MTATCGTAQTSAIDATTLQFGSGTVRHSTTGGRGEGYSVVLTRRTLRTLGLCLGRRRRGENGFTQVTRTTGQRGWVCLVGVVEQIHRQMVVWVMMVLLLLHLLLLTRDRGGYFKCERGGSRGILGIVA